jgi:hypothetical protein
MVEWECLIKPREASGLDPEAVHRDMIISRYLDGDLTHDEVVDELGSDVVDQVEAARDAIEEDVEWGLHA